MSRMIPQDHSWIFWVVLWLTFLKELVFTQKIWILFFFFQLSFTSVLFNIRWECPSSRLPNWIVWTLRCFPCPWSRHFFSCPWLRHFQSCNLLLTKLAWDRTGGTAALWLVRSPPDQGDQVRVPGGDFVLCSWASQFTLTVPLSIQVYKLVPSNLILGVNPVMD